MISDKCLVGKATDGPGVAAGDVLGCDPGHHAWQGEGGSGVDADYLGVGRPALDREQLQLATVARDVVHIDLQFVN